MREHDAAMLRRDWPMRLMSGVLFVLTVISGGRDAPAELKVGPTTVTAVVGRDFSRATTDQSTIQETNDRFVREWKTRIAGRENEPAGKVFENIRLDWFKPTPAGTLLEIMDGGYAKALGVRCTHCHDERDFASDEKRPKRAAREMAAMHWDINQRLKRMENLKSPPDQRAINCGTCHRGSTDPHEPAR